MEGGLAFSTFLMLAALGFVAGAVGTLVGAGGGFLIVPALMLLRPEATPAELASTSLAVVFFNAYSGTLAYLRMGRVDGYAATLFALAGAPGAALAALLVHEVPRGAFQGVFGVLLLALGLTVLRDPLGPPRAGTAAGRAPDLRADRSRARIGAIGSAYLSSAASLLGIGGGVVQVPFLVRVLGFPAHLATGTSQAVLAVSALTATIVHVGHGTLAGRLDETLSLAVGVMMGAPVGAAVSARVADAAIVRALGAALCLVGVRLLLRLL